MSLTEREVILLKVESTYNTDPTPTPAADAILVRSASWAHEGARMADRPLINSTLGTPKKLFGGSLLAVSFEAELKGSGSAGTAPEIGQALRACGLDETVVASTSVTYQPVSSSIESCTIYYYQDGKRKVLTGCRGTVSFNMAAGEPGIASFTFTGHEGTPTDTALVSPTFDATEPETIKGLSLTVNALTHAIESVGLDVSNTVSMPADVTASDGYGEIRLTKRDINGTINPEDVLLATADFIADWKADTERAIDTGVIGSAAGNRYQVNIPRAAYRDVSLGDRDGIRVLDLSFGATENAGDDEFTLAYT
ncbi:MAG: phage tail tube protein [Woeseiaceae bacterium]